MWQETRRFGLSNAYLDLSYHGLVSFDASSPLTSLGEARGATSDLVFRFLANYSYLVGHWDVRWYSCLKVDQCYSLPAPCLETGPSKILYHWFADHKSCLIQCLITCPC